jgi:hypothetical protein
MLMMMLLRFKRRDEIYTVSKDPLYNTFLMNYNQFKLRLVFRERFKRTVEHVFI